MSKLEKAKPNKPHDLARVKVSYEGSFIKEEGKRPYTETINKPLQEVSAIVGNARKLPEFLEHLSKVEGSENGLSAWHFRNKGEAAQGKPISFKANVKKDSSFSYVSEDALGFAYQLHLELVPAPGNRGTIVRMMPAFESGAGTAVAKVEALFGADSSLHAKKTLQRLKAYCETGHVPTIEGQSSGREEETI